MSVALLKAIRDLSPGNATLLQLWFSRTGKIAMRFERGENKWSIVIFVNMQLSFVYSKPGLQDGGRGPRRNASHRFANYFFTSRVKSEKWRRTL
jgi:hypothetical protein